MGGIALNRADQIGYQIMTLAQLGIDIGPALTAILSQSNQPVVNENDHQSCNDYQYQDDQHHVFTQTPVP